MASRSLGTLTLDLIAKVGGFESGMDRAGRAADKRAKEIDTALRKMAKGVERSLNTAAAAAGAVGVAVAAGGIALVKSAANSAREIQNLSAVANTSSEQFQRWAVGAKTVGIEQEKLADILKDTSDKVGDFLSTGGGPLADFFENIAPQIGVTADQFRKLSGPDALQLYVSSLEKAKLGQSEMTFYMEAIASDATALIPLLKDSGMEIERLGDYAERVGSVLSDIEIDQLAEVNKGLSDLGIVFEGLGNKIAVEALPAIRQFTDLIQDPKTVDGLIKIGNGLVYATTRLVDFAAGVGSFGTWIGEEIAAMVNGPAIGDLIRLEKELIDLESDRQSLMLQAEASGRSAGEDPRVQALDLQIAKTKEMIAATNELAEDARNAAKQQASMAALLVPKELLQRTTALGAAYGKTGQQIAAAAKKSAEAEKAFIKEVEKGAKEMAKQRAEAQKLAEARDELFGDARTNIDALEREIAALQQGEAAHKAIVRELAIEAQMRAAVSSGVAENDADYRGLIETQYDLQQALVDVNEDQAEAARIAEQTAKDMETAYNRGVERIRDGLGDFFIDIFETGKVTFSDLTDLFKRMIAEMVATAAANKILLAVGASVGSGGAMAGGLGGGGFDITSLGSWVSAGKSLWSGFSGMMSGQGLSGFAELWGGSAVDQLMVPAWNLTREAAQQTASMTNAVNKMGPILSAIGGAIQGLNTGVKANAVTGAVGGYAGAKAGAAAGTYILPGIGTAVGAIIGGILGSAAGASVFGTDYETTRGGIQLGFGEDGSFDPQQWARQSKKGGWFGSSGRRMIYDQLDTELDTMLNTAYTTTVEGIAQMYAQIGVGVAEGALEGVQIATLQIGTFGKSEQTQEEIEAQIAQWFVDLSDAIVKSVDSGLSLDALAVLAQSITSVNPVLDLLGQTLLDVSKDGAWAAQELLRVSGGLESFAAAADFYYQTFYSEAERLATATGQVNAAFAELGIQMPTTHQGFRDIVEGLDLMTAEGRETYAALMMLAPAFDAVTMGADAAAAALRNSITDMAGTALNQYNNTLAARASLEDQLLDVNGKIADLMADMNESAKEAGSAIESIPATIDDITGSVDQLAASSSQLRSWAQSIQAAVQQLFLSDLSPLTNQQRLAEAQNQFARAQVLAEQGDASQVTSAAQAYLKEAAGYFASSDQYSKIFAEVSGYLSSMGETLETEAQKAERIEGQQRKAQEAQRQATESVRAAMQEADQFSREAAKMQQQEAKLQTLLAEQQRIELALANAYAVDADAVLNRQLQAMVDANDGIGSVVHLLSLLPQDLAAALGGITGVAPAQYGGTTDLAERMFNQILGRAGSAAEIAYWRTMQASGIDGAALVDRFVQQMQAAGNTLLMSGSQFSSSIPAFASGGNYAGGMALVGERGPEIINFSSPGYVHNASETSSMLSGGALVPLVERLLNRIEAMEGLLEQNNRNNARYHAEDRSDMRDQTGETRRINSRLARTGEVEVLGAR